MIDLADSIVSEIFADIRGRRFLKWLFKEEEGVIGDFPLLRSLDLDVQEEIRSEWVQIVRNALAGTDFIVKVDHISCETCKFWDNLEGTDTLVCKRFPPSSGGGFPKASAWEWCGEYSREGDRE